MAGAGEVSVSSGAPAGSRASRLFLLAFITGFSGAMMPGPLLVAVIQQTAIQGFHAAMALVAGHALLELAVVALLVLGFRRVVARPRVRGAIGVIGGIALIYMGADMIRSAAGIRLGLEVEGAAALSVPALLLLGAAVCAANPYFTGWWATVGAGQIAHMAPRTPVQYLSFYLGHEASDFAWYSLVALLVVTGRRWLTDGIYRTMIAVCALALFGIGLWFLVTGIRFVANGMNMTKPVRT